MYNILICDDDKDIVNALKIYLCDPSYTLFTAYDGKQALEIVTKETIHLVLMDVMMPVMDGIAAMVKIREHCNVPVILITAKSEDQDKILGLSIAKSLTELQNGSMKITVDGDLFKVELKFAKV